jgi:hypothetical protein
VLLLVLLGPAAGVGLAAGAPLRADSPAARAVIRECAKRAKPDLVGMDALRADCPTLAKAIQDLGLTAHLPQDWEEDVAASDLADWSALADRYDGSAAPPMPLPDSSRLQTIARFLRPPPEPPNWWERLKTWVVSWFDPERGQWPDWLRWPAQWRPGNAILYGVMGLVLIAAAVVIAMELRAAGVFGAGRRRRAPPKRSATDIPTNSAHWQEPGRIDEPVEQLGPERLLRVLVAALTKSHRLERDRDLTCRELITAARFDTTAQREIFAGVALLAEQILYGDPRRPPLNDRKLGQSARGLYGELLAAPAGQPSK